MTNTGDQEGEYSAETHETINNFLDFLWDYLRSHHGYAIHP